MHKYNNYSVSQTFACMVNIADHISFMKTNGFVFVISYY